MIFTSRENEKVKLTDGREVYLSRSVAVMSVVIARVGGFRNKKDYALVSQRGKDTPDFQGLFCCPCGYLDWDENGVDGAAREVWEETDINLKGILKTGVIEGNKKCKIRVLSNYYRTQPFWVNSEPEANRQNVTLCYGLRFSVPEFDMLPTPSGINVNTETFEEVADAKWVPVNEIALGKHEFAFGHDKRIIQFMNDF